ncbi:MAG: hypothetical protein ACHQIL_11360 [Steroidobacterales bacterium]
MHQFAIVASIRANILRKLRVIKRSVPAALPALQGAGCGLYLHYTRSYPALIGTIELWQFGHTEERYEMTCMPD